MSEAGLRNLLGRILRSLDTLSARAALSQKARDVGRRSHPFTLCQPPDLQTDDCFVHRRCGCSDGSPRRNRGYALNNWVTGIFWGQVDRRCEFPAQTIIISDGRCFNTGWTSSTPWPLNRVGDSYNADGTIKSMRHNDVVNALFADGHVKAMKPTGTETSADVNSPWTGRWQ
ncbi:MAG: hypothetical protein H5T86_08180 [Armatimonadetes bacterium]|nr:hypothetical protein [Armatimonadota bacterium]